MLLGVLQENLLVLLTFDEQRSPIIRNTIDVALFGGQYKTIAARIYDYIDKFKKPPKAHISDILDDKINSDNKREAELYSDVITSINDAQQGINAEYVMSQLETFVRRQSLRTVAIDLSKALQRDTEESLEEADALIKKATTQGLSLFDAGTRLSDSKRSLEFLDANSISFPTGIAELDKRGFGPTRKEFWLFIANTKGGKTWMLIHLAKMALMHRLKVLHVTLEMSETRAAQRYFQAFFNMSKRDELFKSNKFQLDSLGRISGFNPVNLKPTITMDDPKIRGKLEKRITKWSKRMLDNIIVKQFPTGGLTVAKLRAYLDNLEVTERFVPDLLVIDYPDLMKIPGTDHRLGLDELYKELRGIGVERNIAVAAVSQSHRGAAKAKLVGAENVAEAYSKIAHSDTVITLSQTPAEAQMGLARLHVAAGRNDSDKVTLVISQNYGTGMFVIDSVVMRGNYFGLLPPVEGDVEE